MKHTRTSLFLLVLPLLLEAAALTACGSKTTESVVTETGNPPFIDEDGIATQALGGKITVTGRAGSTTPNATVTLTDLTSGDSTTQHADADGAFTASVSGNAGDELKLKITNDGKTTEVVVAARSPGAETDAATTATTAASSQTAPSREECQRLAETDPRYTDFLSAAQSADTSCSKDTDCGAFSYSAWYGARLVGAVSTSALADLEAPGEELSALSAELADQGCVTADGLPILGPPAFPYGVGCIEGMCGALPDTTIAEPETCQQIAEGAFDLIPGLEASGSCNQDTDCIAVARSTSCVPTCKYYVTSAAAAEAAAADLARQETEVCASLSAQNCEVPYSGFICPPIVFEPPTPVCVDNLCVAE